MAENNWEPQPGRCYGCGGPEHDGGCGGATIGLATGSIAQAKPRPSFNHTRGDSPRTPCARCAVECGWTYADAETLECPKCKTLCSTHWLNDSSGDGIEHVCVDPLRPDGATSARVGNALTCASDAGPEVSDLKAIRDSLRAERDDYRKLFEGACARLEGAKHERDAWKRRAEAAEQSLKFVSDGARAAWQTRDMLRVESGPGIGPKRMGFAPDNSIAHLDFAPDNSIAHLDEDLLCDDA